MNICIHIHIYICFILCTMHCFKKEASLMHPTWAGDLEGSGGEGGGKGDRDGEHM